MPIQYLNGTDNVRFGDEFEGLGSLLQHHEGGKFYRDYLKRHKMQLKNTRSLIHRDPKRFKNIYNVHRLGEMYDQLIGAWDDDNSREAMLNHLSGIEDEALRPELQGLGHIIHGSDDELFGEIINADFSMDGLGRRKLFRSGILKKKITGAFTKIKNAHKKVKEEVQKLKTKEGRKALFDKIKKGLKKFNPVTLAVRAAMLVAMRTNAGRIASRAYWGYFSKDEAKRAGVTESYWSKAKKAVNALEKLFVERLSGDASTLRKSIVSGRAAKKLNRSKLSGLEQLTGFNGLGDDAESTDTSSTESIDTGGEETKKGGFSKIFSSIANFFRKLFKKKNGQEETETGGETAPPSPTDTSTGPIVSVDNAVQTYKSLVNDSSNSNSSSNSSSSSSDSSASEDSGSSDNSDGSTPENNTTVKAGEGKGTSRYAGQGRDGSNDSSNSDSVDENGNSTSGGTSSSTGMMLGLATLAGFAIVAGMSKNKKEKKSPSTVGSVKKTTAKSTNKKKIKEVELS